MRTFNSPGGASMVIMFEVSPRSGEGQKRGQNDGGMLREFCALCDAPNWLAAESVHASRAAPSLSMGQAISMPPSIANKSRQRSWLRASQISIGCTHRQGMGMHAQIRAQSGASGTQKVQPPALIRSPAKMGRYRCDKKATENGEFYRPGPQNQQLNHQVNEGATILFGR